MKPSTLNRIWARLILMSLSRAGVKDICIAPGSRSTPLTLEAEALSAKNPSVRIHTHFDERGLGFLALGLAKTTDNPVAVIVTSGTAVANLIPAAAESRLTREKLIFLTADRPPELIQCGANQAISQEGIFSHHAETTTFLPSPSEAVSPSWLLSVIGEGLHQLVTGGGSYHINCPFPEPLYGEMEDASHYLAPVNAWLAGDQPYLSFTHAQADLQTLLPCWQALQHQRGILVAGRMRRDAREAVQSLADHLGWPLLCDPQAGEGSDFAGFDVWLQNPDCSALLKQTEVVIQFGGRLVSKRLGQFVDDFKGAYWLVDKHPGRLDPSHRSGTRIIADIHQVALALEKGLEKSPANAGWGDMLKMASARYLALLDNVAGDTLSELSMATHFGSWLVGGSDLFIGNSMAIRLLDMGCRLPACEVFANRGASGIDGLIATAAGVQRGREKPMLMVMGDTSALYDLNSLALLANNLNPMALVIINNDGGGIFDMLPVPETQKETYYRMPHGLSFSHAAAMFGLKYQRPATLHEAKNCCLEAQSNPGTSVIELCTPAGACGQDLKALFADIAHASLI